MIRAAIHTFTNKNNSFNNNISENVQYLRQLVSEVTASDIGLTPNIGFPRALYTPASKGIAPVTYIDIFENNYVSVGVFVIKEGASIPLHDHKGMFGILKVLYGNLNIQSYTPISQESDEQSSPVLPSFSSSIFTARKMPESSLTSTDMATVLSPSEGNIHKLWTSGGSASFLDVLAPPYNPEEGRDCFYYEEVNNQQSHPDPDHYSLMMVPTPATFWSDSASYQGPRVQHLLYM